MFSDIGPLEVVTLVVLAVILVGPDRLPKMVSDTVRTLRKLRELSQSAQASIREELPPEFKELAFENLSPKAFMTGSLLMRPRPGSGRSPRRPGLSKRAERRLPRHRNTCGIPQ